MDAINEKLERLLDSNTACVGFLFVFCVATFGIPLLWGIPSGHDLITDLRFTYALQDALLSGQFFPGWANDNFGFGSIGIRFYPPLAFYLLALTELITADWFWALWANFLFWMFLGVLGTYLFVRDWGTPAQALLAGICYAMVPQHLSDALQAFLFAQFASWALIPFCFLFVTRICRKQNWSDVLLFALSYSLLILTHLPTTIIVSFCLPIYVLVVMDWGRYLNIFLRLSASIGLTIAATSFRWLTIISEYNWLAHNNPRWTSGYFLYSQWLFPNVFTDRGEYLWVLSSWLIDAAIVLSVALIIPAVVYLIKTRNGGCAGTRRIVIGSVCTTLFAFFMLSRAGEFVWEAIPFLQKIQFPFRWLSVLSFCAVVAFAFSVPVLMNIFKGRERLIAYPALALGVAIVLFDVTQIYIPSGPIPDAEFSKLEQRIQDEPIFEGWWPVWAKNEAFEENSAALAGGRSIEVPSSEGTDKVFVVGDGEPTSLSVPTFYYPHWRATVNGKPVDVDKNENGVIVVPIGEGVSNVRLYFDEPLHTKLAIYVSLVTWLSLLFALGRSLLKRFNPVLDEKHISTVPA